MKRIKHICSAKHVLFKCLLMNKMFNQNELVGFACEQICGLSDMVSGFWCMF